MPKEKSASEVDKAFQKLLDDIDKKSGNFLCPACLEPFVTRAEKHKHMEVDHGYETLRLKRERI